MVLKLVIGAVCLGLAIVLYCCCRVAGEADARMDALEAQQRREESGDSG